MHSFWNGKKVLVTGHTGFVGTWLCTALKMFGADVVGFSLKEEKGSLYEKVKSELKVFDCYGDLRQYDKINDCVNECNPEIVFHIAAYGFVKECYESPDKAYEINVNGTLNLMKAMKNCDAIKTIIIASSDKVYENKDKENVLFCEEDNLGGMDTYSCSKTCEELVARSFFDTYFQHSNVTMEIVRPSNILGGGDHNYNRLVPSILNSLNCGTKLEIKNPNAVRPWQNILDMIDAYLTLAELGYKTELKKISIYNVGPKEDEIKTVGEIVDYFESLFKTNINMMRRISNKEEVREYKFLGLSIKKIEKDIGWKPRRKFIETLNEVYYFYKRDNGLNTYDICKEQIYDYYH